MHPVDAGYRGFPPFSDWAEAKVAPDLWDQATRLLAERRRLSDLNANALTEQATRIASIDTGAIEGLYTVDRGFTVSVAAMASGWEAQIQREKGPEVAALVAAQRAAYDMSLDAAISKTDIGEAWVRRLHEVACAAQHTYEVRTPIGPQRQPLPKGTYKTAPNHVEFADGSVHAYAPVEDTPAEMHRLTMELCTPAFAEAHPALQSSYAHYALVCIHPFADGNGRVARALASVYTFRATSLPFVLFADEKPEYLQALNHADESRVQSFVDFVFFRLVELHLYLAEALRAGAAPTIGASASRLGRIVVAPDEGPTEDELDAAARVLVKHMLKGARAALQTHELPDQVDWEGATVLLGLHSPARFRRLGGGRYAEVRASIPTSLDQKVSVSEVFGVLLHDDPGTQYRVRILREGTDDFLDARLADIYPRVTRGFERRLGVWVGRIVSEALDRLADKAEMSRGSAGED